MLRRLAWWLESGSWLEFQSSWRGEIVWVSIVVTGKPSQMEGCFAAETTEVQPVSSEPPDWPNLSPTKLPL